MENNTLYEIDSKLLEVIDKGFSSLCVNEDGEIDDGAMQEYLISLQGERKDKIENISLYIKDLKAQAAAIEEEEKKLEARKKSKERKAKILSDYVKASLLAFGDKKFETARVVLSVRKTEQVEIDDESILPKEYVRETVKLTPDKKALKEALKAGELIDGVRIVENQNLIIK